MAEFSRTEADEQATETKVAGLEDLVTAPTALEVPGQPRSLEAPHRGWGWIFLDWKRPADGGDIAAYKIERRERPSGDWILVSMAIEPESTLNNQERGKDLEYRVIATNKAGESVPSNTVAAVL